MICKRCGQDKDISNFRVIFERTGSRNSVCKQCMVEASRQARIKGMETRAAEEAAMPKRTCLRCGKQFPSYGPQNRLCKMCNQTLFYYVDDRGVSTGTVSMTRRVPRCP